jgi:hypothetical protein
LIYRTEHRERIDINREWLIIIKIIIDNGERELRKSRKVIHRVEESLLFFIKQ